jgi:hypothetical protein
MTRAALPVALFNIQRDVPGACPGRRDTTFSDIVVSRRRCNWDLVALATEAEFGSAATQ